MALAEQTGQDPALVIALGMLAPSTRGTATKVRWTRRRSRDRARRAPQRAAAAIYARHARALVAERPTRRSSGSRRCAPKHCPATCCGRRTWSTRTCAPAAATTPPSWWRTTRARSRIPGSPPPSSRASAAWSRGGDTFEAALERHQAGPAPFELARTQLAYGEYLRATDRREEARELLRRRSAAFERIEALPFAERARRELRAAGAITRARHATPRS